MAWLFGVAIVWAGPQFIDRSGYAVSGYDVVAYHSLSQAEIGQRQPLAVAGKIEHAAMWNGAFFIFSTQVNRDLFVADPAKFAPQFDGHCAMGVAAGAKIPANPHLWRIVDNKLYLNINGNVARMWHSDIPGHLTKAQQNWPELRGAPASGGGVPGLGPLDIPAPMAGS
jgi:hypothetical protein